jgi:hypothetical protein
MCLLFRHAHRRELPLPSAIPAMTRRFQFSLASLFWLVLVVAVNVVTWQAFYRDVILPSRDTEWVVVGEGALPPVHINTHCVFGHEVDPGTE